MDNELDLNESSIEILESDKEVLILSNMFAKKYAQMEMNALVAFCKVINLKFIEDIKQIENATRNQSSSP